MVDRASKQRTRAEQMVPSRAASVRQKDGLHLRARGSDGNTNCREQIPMPGGKLTTRLRSLLLPPPSRWRCLRSFGEGRGGDELVP
jgi:hypothetical protein